MAANTNVVVLTGNLVKDAETRDAGSTKVTQLTIACNENVKKGDNWEQYANFFDLTWFGGKRAETLSQYLKKGQRIAVEGRLRQDRWEKDGQKQSRIVVRVENIELIGGKAGNGGNSESSSAEDNGYPESIPF